MMEHNGFEYVDLGLSVNWATMNVGANSINDRGLYFQWGENLGYTINDIMNNKCPNFYSSNNGIIDKTDFKDACAINMGGNWRTPTANDIQELRYNTIFTRIKHFGVEGVLYTSKTDKTKTLFFPYVGYMYKKELISNGVNCYIWVNELNDLRHHPAYFPLGYNSPLEYCSRFYGLSMRGVFDKN